MSRKSQYVVMQLALPMIRFTQYTLIKYSNNLWLATCTRKPKGPGSSLAVTYEQKWALSSNFSANV